MALPELAGGCATPRFSLFTRNLGALGGISIPCEQRLTPVTDYIPVKAGHNQSVVTDRNIVHAQDRNHRGRPANH